MADGKSAFRLSLARELSAATRNYHKKNKGFCITKNIPRMTQKRKFQTELSLQNTKWLYPQSYLINFSFDTGVFPNRIKICQDKTNI